MRPSFESGIGLSRQTTIWPSMIFHSPKGNKAFAKGNEVNTKQERMKLVKFWTFLWKCCLVNLYLMCQRQAYYSTLQLQEDLQKVCDRTKCLCCKKLLIIVYLMLEKLKKEYPTFCDFYMGIYKQWWALHSVNVRFKVKLCFKVQSFSM